MKDDAADTPDDLRDDVRADTTVTAWAEATRPLLADLGTDEWACGGLAGGQRLIRAHEEAVEEVRNALDRLTRVRQADADHPCQAATADAIRASADGP